MAANSTLKNPFAPHYPLIRRAGDPAKMIKKYAESSAVFLAKPEKPPAFQTVTNRLPNKCP